MRPFRSFLLSMSPFDLFSFFMPAVRPQQLPRLEVLTALPTIPDQTKPPIVFLHGAFCAGWVWQEHFLDWFAGQGHAAYALSLRGHGGSDGKERLSETSFAEYVEDLAETIKTITAEAGQAPIVVAHSMGGMVAQHWLARFDSVTLLESPPCQALILLSSVPPSGLATTGFNMLVSDPTLIWQLSAVPVLGEGAVSSFVQRAMFAPDAPPALIGHYSKRMQDESMRVSLDMNCALPPNPRNGKALPMLVIGADHDAFITPWMSRSTAAHYGCPCVILDNTGHAIMLGPTWRVAAETIHNWLIEQNLSQ